MHEKNNFSHIEFWVRAKTLFISFTLRGALLKLIIYLAKLREGKDTGNYDDDR